MASFLVIPPEATAQIPSTPSRMVLPGVVLPNLEFGHFSPDSDRVTESIPDCLIDQYDDQCERWVSTYDGSGHGVDYPGDGAVSSRSILPAPERKSVHVAGTSDVDPGEEEYDLDAVVIGYEEATGQQRWVTHYEGTPKFPHAVSRAMALSPDGRSIYLLTHNLADFEFSECEMGLAALDLDSGEERWRISWREPAARCTVPVEMESGITTRESGERVQQIYVQGYLYGGTLTTPFVRAYEIRSDGQFGGLAWERQHATEHGAIALALGLSQGGETLYLGTGEKISEASSWRRLSIVAFRADTGKQLWEAIDPGPNRSINGAVDLVIDPDGSRVFASGIASPDFDLGQATIALHTFAVDALNGEPLWSRRREETDANLFKLHEGTMAVSPDGSRLFVTAEFVQLFRRHGWILVAYDSATGQERWDDVSTDLGRFESGLGAYPALALSPDGNRVFVTGPRNSISAVSEYATASYDSSNGEQQWMARYPGGAAHPMSIATSADSASLYVLGRVDSRLVACCDLGTVSYSTELTP